MKCTYISLSRFEIYTTAVQETPVDMDLESLIIQRITEVSDKIDYHESNLTPIQEFYEDTKIFVTGATGFLGQLLLEKLLRCCRVSTFYVLVRNKKGKDSKTRLNELFDDVLFKRLKNTYPDFQQKVVIVEGDCALPNLGINDQDREMLIDEVNIVFHIAATVRFDEKLKTAAAINIRGTRDLSRLAQQMKKLKSFVHISTAFSNCIHEVIEEKVYPTTVGYKHLLQITEALDDCLVDNLTPHFLGKYPNTYVYTKHVGEDVVQEETKGLPSGIYRPAVVASTLREPIRGWINNFYGVAGIAFGNGIGLLRVFYCTPNSQANIVPADMCVNGMIASAWDIAQRFQKSRLENEKFELPLYNYESTNDKPIDWIFVREKSQKYGRLTPSVKCLWVDFLILISSYRLYTFMIFFFHTIPGVIVDASLFLRGKKMRLTQAYRKIHAFSEVVFYFSIRKFDFRSFNVHKMLSNMTKRDKEVFFCDIKDLDWDEFFMTYLAGCRLYLVKDPLETLPQARKLRRKFIWANRAVIAVLGLFAITTLWFLLSVIYRNIFFA